MFDIEHYFEAKSVEDAVRLLSEHEDAQIISGGTDVLVKLREGKDAGGSLVSIHEIPVLHGVRSLEDGTLELGPATCFTDITNDPLISRYVPYLGEAVDTVGGPQIRNQGTIGGNVCNGATSADSAATLQTLNAVVVLQGPEGVRRVPVTEFYTGPGRTVREHNEVCRAIEIRPEDYVGFTGCYIKYGKRAAMEIATLGCCVRVKLDAGLKTICEARIGYGVAAPTPIRCRNTEAALAGKSVDDEAIYDIIGNGVLEEVNPRSSWRASKEFRLQLISELAKRALKDAIGRSLNHEAPAKASPKDSGCGGAGACNEKKGGEQ